MTGNNSVIHENVVAADSAADDWGGIDTTPSDYKLESVQAPKLKSVSDLRNHILTYDDAEWEILCVPEWGNVPLIIRSGTGETRADLLDASITIDERTEKTSVDLKKIYPDLVIHSVVDPSSVPGVDADTILACDPSRRKDYSAAVANAPTLFTIMDRGGLLVKNGAALERIGKVASRLWGLDKEAEKAAEKN